MFQFGTKIGEVKPEAAGSEISATDQNNGQSQQSVPEDITSFYDKMDKDDEDEEEEAVLKTVSFEVNQVKILQIYQISEKH